MIKADFISAKDAMLVGPVIVEGTALQLLFELNAIVKEFMEMDNTREIIHAVVANNIGNINKQADKIDVKKFNACYEILERNSK